MFQFFSFASLVCFPAGITSSAIAIKICAFTAGIKKYKSVIKKTKWKHDKTVFLGKDKLNTIEVLISKALVNNVLRESDERRNNKS